MKDKQKEILIEAWKMYQNLAKGFGENSWKIKTLGIGFWSTVIAYGYKNSDAIIYLFSILIVVMFFFIDCGMKTLQYKYIKKSIEVEKGINDYLVGSDSLSFPSNGISTNVEAIQREDYIFLIKLRSWRFWIQYLCMALISIFMLTYSPQNKSVNNINANSNIKYRKNNDFNSNFEKTLIYFNLGESELSISGEKKLEKLQEFTKEIKSVIVIPYTDTTGTNQMNRKISSERGENVQKKLMKIGIPKEKIFISSSNTLLIETSINVKEPLNRTVQMIIEVGTKRK
ncbi:OmpA family protein [Psychrilyobacter atlanticus]|uniref:OmpA family protein n=1 Tax=Psychrilyobacter atlanticus TaxID=271091 RepID=UPI000413A6B7|nr:OmpA family protein [Psychrilyobacter atlanticus]